MKKFCVLALVLVAASLTAASSNEVEITNEGHHHQVLENDFVRVFKVEVGPKDATLMHRHRHDYLFISIGPADVSNEVEGKPAAELKLHDGQTGFLPGNFAHIARNLADTPFRNVTIELLQDETSRTAPPSRWDQERGLNVLHGGTQEILFVKDGARVSEIELQPGGMIPSHHHNGAHLLVAVSDLEVRSDVEGQGPMPGHFKSGDIKWLPGGYTHTLTNVGKQPAKFVTVEFP
jgi:oxalate decarboxylase/phosphoglucose isomerase-like protein (cupin superfamily)